MIEREELMSIYDIYKELLTLKQKEYFEMYYFEDLSLSEIAENFKVSKSIVGKTLKLIEKKIKMYEKTLGIYKLNKKLEKIALSSNEENIKKELMNIINNN